MEERQACALLKQRFEAAGYRIQENIPFDEEGVQFEIDGFDPDARVGYEYISTEAGDSWDVDEHVVAALDARRKNGEIHVLLVDEADASRIGELADAFLSELKKAVKPAKKPAAKKPAAKKPTAAAKPKAPAKKKAATKK
jgi:hypothetical protein